MSAMTWNALPMTCAVVLPLLLALAGPAPAQTDGLDQAAPTAVVARVNETLIGAMREAEALAFQGRYDRLAPVFEAAFHFPVMARGAAGRHWRDFEPDEKERLAEAFAHMSVATYAARFDGYGGERFEVGEAIEQPRGRVLVRNRLITGAGEAISIDYLLGDFDGRWRIVDVFLEGTISEIATKRSEYGGILKRDGFDGLLARIAEKTAELAAENGR